MIKNVPVSELPGPYFDHFSGVLNKNKKKKPFQMLNI
jgi:hypothetical protein